MRPIKFRAWDKKGKWMDYSHLASSANENFDVSLNEVFTDNGFVFQQFTGLLDKNGKEIYEGDVVKLDCSSNKKNSWLAEIAWNEQTAQIDFRIKKGDIIKHQATGGHRCFDYCEVLGNIYENPELLK